eukprot:Tamp_09990.p1 GENE.Tamp_09990~~Tamp_09990.p1  ORF type:complete len:580 (-),score=204.40 Tamp_09990:276-2015(-)
MASDGLALRAGRAVRIDGLQKRADLNGRKGRVVRQEGERWVVKVAGLDEIALMPANLVAEEPEKKRARFAPDAETGSRESSMDDESASGDAEDGEEGGSEDEDSEDKAPQHTRWAEEVTTIRMLRGGAGAGVECEAGRFAPLYTHQVFYTAQGKDEEASDRERQELIIGYDEPKLEISYAANSLKAHVEFSCKGQVDVKLLKQESLSRTPVLNSLHKRVPMDYATKLSAVQAEAEAPFSPLGTLLEEEKLPDGGLLQVFHFTADSPEAVKLVQRMQTFAVWLIETGQAIEVPDPRWNILTLYRVDKGADEQPVHTMLGFYTAYRYWVYDKERNELDKFRLRLSQCIIFPPFQRQGHGARLLRAFYKMGREDASVLDMSVEDPSPEFQALRDLTDVKHLQGEAGALEAAAKACGQAEELSQMAGKLKLCLPQMTRLSVLARFILLQLTDPEADPEREQIKDLRLLVKKSLYKEHMCLAKGRIQFDSDDEEEGQGNDEAKGTDPAARRAASSGKRKSKEDDDMDDAPADLKKQAMSEMEAAMRKLAVWSNGGDAEERKTQLREMFADKYRQLAAVAAKVCR